MTTVGCGMIMKDCADTLDVCLQSIKGLFDVVVAVDTGSTDDSIKIAKSYGVHVIEHPWVYDFSAVRNISFGALDTDYKAWIDADDLLVGQEYFEEMLNKCIDMDLDGIILEYIYSLDDAGQAILANIEPQILERKVPVNLITKHLMPHCNTTQYRERLVKNIPGWNWKYPVHEALPAFGRRLGKYDNVKVIHRRHLRKNPASSGRNLDILNRVPESMRDERIWFYLGLEHASHSNLDEAIHGFENHIRLGSVDDERYLSYHFLGDLYRSKGDYARSIANDLNAVAIRPTWRDAYAGLLETTVKIGDWQRALYYGAMCQKSEIPDTPFAFNPMHETVGWSGDFILTLLHFGMLEEARQEALRYLEHVPNDRAMLSNLDSINVEMNIAKGSESISDAVEFFLRNDDAETAALILARSHPRVRSNPSLKKWISVASSVCGPAAHGIITPDPLKIDPVVPFLESYNRDKHNWYDHRMQFIFDALKIRPYTKKLLVLGAPIEALNMLDEIGLSVTYTDKISAVEEVNETFDMAVLWNCLERVKRPDQLVALCRSKINLGGDLVAIVPNGPATKGLAPPDAVLARLRAYDVDSFRRVVGTVRMPMVSAGWSAESGQMCLVAPMPLPIGRSRSIAIVCPYSPEPWGPDSLNTGIGGSEEAVIRLARAFSRRGHSVTVYGSGWKGNDISDSYVVDYKDLKDYTRSDIFVGWRYPEIFYNQIRPFEAGWKILWLHDSMDKVRVEQAIPFIDAVWTISDYHASLYAGLSRIYGGRNGIDPWEFDFKVERNPNKLVYVSTPFRGLDTLLELFPEIKRRVPEAEVHAYYGWESADKMGSTSTPEGAAFKARVQELCKQPGVVWHGRVGQQELYREVASASVFSYPSRHPEENCISCYIAQACGTWPVTTTLGALPQSNLFGWKVDLGGFVDTVVEAMRTDEGRDTMSQWARSWLSWDEVASTFERLWRGMPG